MKRVENETHNDAKTKSDPFPLAIQESLLQVITTPRLSFYSSAGEVMYVSRQRRVPREVDRVL